MTVKHNQLPEIDARVVNSVLIYGISDKPVQVMVNGQAHTNFQYDQVRIHSNIYVPGFLI